MPATPIPNSRDATIRTIGEKYSVTRLLGAGGMGTVYECVNAWTGRRVAIKLLRPELSQIAPIVKRFVHEAQASSLIAHPNIVDVLDLGTDPGTGSFFIVQAFLEGEDLASWMRRQGPLSPREALHLALPVMDAIASAHEHGIVHRDIKPENIILATSSEGEIVPTVIDFGISKCVSGESTDRTTQKGMAIGTPEYMSPEQARGDCELDARTDIWSVGTLLFELLTGTIPFDAATHNLIVLRVLTEEVPRIEKYLPEIPTTLAEIVHRALARDREARFPTMREMLRAVRKFAAHELGGTTPPALRLRLGDSPRAMPSCPPPSITLAEGTLEPLCDLQQNNARTNPAPKGRAWLQPFSFAIATAAVLAVATLARAPREVVHHLAHGPALTNLAAHLVVQRDPTPPRREAPPPNAPSVATPPLAVDSHAPSPVPTDHRPPPSALASRGTTGARPARIDVMRRYHLDVE